MAGKGDRPRPVNKKKYFSNYEEIKFSKKRVSKDESFTKVKNKFTKTY